MRSLHLGGMAAERADELPDKPANLPGTDAAPPIRLGAWARWLAAREGGTGRPTGATPAVQRAQIGSTARRPYPAATD